MNAEYLIDLCDKVHIHKRMWLEQEINAINNLTL
jgi:hypothetical protein